jgi:hypothetical protein
MSEPTIGPTMSCNGSGSITGLFYTNPQTDFGTEILVRGNPYVSGGYKGTPRVLHQAHILNVIDTSGAFEFVNNPVTRAVSGWLNGEVTIDNWTAQGYTPGQIVELTIEFRGTVTSTKDLQEVDGVGSYQAYSPQDS